MLDFFITPFADYIFLRRALMACVSLAFGCGPVGVLLVLRRMSLMGDALAHAILPGAALGFLVGGLSLPAKCKTEVTDTSHIVLCHSCTRLV